MTVLRILAALSVLSLVACSNTTSPATAANSTTDDQPIAPPVPSIHYDQTTVLTAEGVPAEEHAYRISLER